MKQLAEYDGISPVTNELSVIEEVDDQSGVTTYICMQSGWMTYETLKIDSEAVTLYEQGMPDLILDSRVIDTTRGLVWYPTFIQLPGAILHPAGNSPNEFVWQVSPIVDLSESERVNYLIPGTEDQYYTSMLDVEHAYTYDKLQFEQALDQLFFVASGMKENYDNKLRDNSMQ